MAYHVRMQDEGSAQDAIEDGIGRSDKSGTDDGNQGSRYQALKGPMVRAVRFVGFREEGSIVDGTLNEACEKRFRS
jgi:hypothetical protein